MSTPIGKEGGIEREKEEGKRGGRKGEKRDTKIEFSVNSGKSHSLSCQHVLIKAG